MNEAGSGGVGVTVGIGVAVVIVVVVVVVEVEGVVMRGNRGEGLEDEVSLRRRS